VFNGLRVRMGIATGHLQPGTSVRTSAVLDMAKGGDHDSCHSITQSSAHGFSNCGALLALCCLVWMLLRATDMTHAFCTVAAAPPVCSDQ
jgi:hypothetical protein